MPRHRSTTTQDADAPAHGSGRRRDAQRGSRPERARRHGVPGWWALPGVAVVLALIYVPTALGGFYAFTDWKGIGGWNWVGLENFQADLQDKELLGSLKNTLFLAFGFLVLTNVFGLLFALALNRSLKTRYLLRTLVFMPVVLAPDRGVLRLELHLRLQRAAQPGARRRRPGLWQHDWLADPTLAKFCVLTVMVWQNIGFVMVIYLAGLATVPVELEEAAALDGAGRGAGSGTSSCRCIKPSVAIATTLMLIQGLRVFDQIMALTGGGPAGATQTLATEIYQQTFVFGKFGFGAALALLLSVMILSSPTPSSCATRDRSTTGA